MMPLTTPTIVADPTTIDRLAVDWMLHVDSPIAQRISKGAEIAKAGGVTRDARPFRFWVASQSQDAVYLVDHGQCQCPDAQKRGAHECKHAWCVRLAVQAERADAEAGDPTITITVESEDSILDLWPVGDGEPCEMAPRTAGGAITVLPLSPRAQALRAELYDDERPRPALRLVSSSREPVAVRTVLSVHRDIGGRSYFWAIPRSNESGCGYLASGFAYTEASAERALAAAIERLGITNAERPERWSQSASD